MKFSVKVLLVLTVLTLTIPSADAQIGWTMHDIDLNFNGAWNLYIIDLDGDSDVDIVGCAKEADEIAWYENDGSQNFTKHMITSNFEEPKRVMAVDIDSDGDLDVIGAAKGPSYCGLITWWENDGNQNFTEHNISSDFEYTHWVEALDMDGDNDIDILSASTWGHQVAWWENNGSQVFSQHFISANFSYPYAVNAADLDGDNDIDVLGVAAYEDLSWFENNGSQNFTRHPISQRDSLFGASIAIKDMDNDGDLDVLTSDLWTHDVMWYENNGSQNFSERIIDYHFYGCWYIHTSDVDNDGDIDVTGAAWRDSAITWWENNGTQTFTRHDLSLNFSKARCAFPADLDGDGDVDIVGSSERGDRIAWWESDHGTFIARDIESALPENMIQSAAYPNPFNASTTISFALPKTAHITVEIYNLLGQKEDILINETLQAGNNRVTWNAGDKKSGVYFYRITAGELVETNRIMLVK